MENRQLPTFTLIEMLAASDNIDHNILIEHLHDKYSEYVRLVQHCYAGTGALYVQDETDLFSFCV